MKKIFKITTGYKTKKEKDYVANFDSYNVLAEDASEAIKKAMTSFSKNEILEEVELLTIIDIN